VQNALRARLMAIGGALAVCAVVGLPQLRYIADGHVHALLVDGDEVAYAARVQEAIDGHWRTASPYAWEHKEARALTPAGGPVFLAALARLTNANMDSIVMITRFVAPAISALLLAAILFQLIGSAGWSVVGMSVIMLDPGAYYYKPAYYITSLLAGFPLASELHLSYARFINPILLIIPFLIGFRCLIWVVAQPRPAIGVAAGVAIGLNFYIEPYYATYLGAWTALLLCFYLRDPAARRAIAVAAIVAVVIASPVLLQNAFRFQGLGLEVVQRYGGGLQTRSSPYLFHKGAIISALLFAVFYKGRPETYRVLLSGMIGGFLLLNQQLVTGREILNYHYNYANAIVSLSGLVALTHDRLGFASRWMRRPLPQRWITVAGATAMIWLVVNGFVMQYRFYDASMSGVGTVAAFRSNSRDRFEHTIAWINSQAPKDSVFLADPHVAFVVPVYTHANAFLNPNLVDDGAAAMSDEELFERYMIHLKLREMTPAEVFDMVKAPPNVPFPSWKFGRTPAMKTKFPFDHAATFSAFVTNNALAQEYVTAYRDYPDAMVAQGLKKYRLDYLALSDVDTRFRRTAPSYFDEGALEQVAVIHEEGVQVFRVSLSR
jgi:hypothetical protein